MTHPSRVHFCENSIETLLGKLQEMAPLRFREVFVEARDTPTHIHVCEEDHVHVVYNLQETPTAIYNAVTVLAYTIAIALDTGVHAPPVLTRSMLNRAGGLVHEILTEVNREYADGFKSSMRVLETLYQGEVVEAIEVPAPGQTVKPRPKPVSEDEIRESLNTTALMRAAFGYTLADGPGTPKVKGEN